ncbi:solanesyl diphosphate synthase [Leptolyngbya sp. FACHB-261]|uniref:solanesyl diphosphate synthase n=1 Tax=Leptolyngbya sp. FACHB-261 TaxID=2692806 RepID=UPI00168420C7|nr:solanesyl diphosphate synthase [Leptolyngbya sp. FACHB-261]MBD2099367.1 solanesyl diphosphate synthase [Leptolyngbya sp. FACHB-261]
MTSVTSLFAPVEAELSALSANLKKLVGARHPILYAAAEHLFEAQGKGLRPAIVLLIAQATVPPGQGISARHRRLAEITEMIHTASLVHDDVIDTADIRRGVDTVNSLFGNRVAVLAGDYLFAQSSWYLANLDNLEVVKLLSKVITDLAEGEIRQSLTQFDTSLSIEDYLDKSFYKTASLMSGSAKAAAVLSGVEPELAEQLYEYGRHFGIAFQIVDDLLDFTSSTEALGKPAGSDLRQGNLTAPVLFALRSKPQLEPLIERQFAQPGDLQQALGLIEDSNGLALTKDLAAKHARSAVDCLAGLPPSVSRQALIDLTEYVLNRLY